MDRLDALENQSIYIIREGRRLFPNIAMLWSIGKDSTTLLWLCYKAFFGRVPFPVIHIDTSYKFREIYEFRDRLARELNLKLIVARNDPVLAGGMGPEAGSKLDCCTELKTNALKQVIQEYGFQAILLGIRRDEHGIRAKERYFSPRSRDFTWNYTNQQAELWRQFSTQVPEEEGHTRIHPILHFTEIDIWRYIRREQLPAVELYFSKGGKRYRSIGCEPCCSPINSEAKTVDDIIAELESSHTSERAGRAQDKENEYTMQKLRSLGYM
ncbi:MAG TPA: sulfate adenylyltransferase subunit CysD [Candidatus Tripitaka californicus]|uniref:sulfate adenylyltransferase subunit CysD n=1 Tax=Candidatus Tripitaka californicus TaxID=3367616 RepID=UPI0040280497